MMTDMKQCSRCKQEFPATREYFRAHKSGHNGLVARCKSCEKEAAKHYQYGKPDPNATKACTKCGVVFPATKKYFYSMKAGRYGLTPNCKSCLQERNHQRNYTPLDDPTVPKQCSRCKRNYPATTKFFPSDKRRSDGLGSNCKSCRREISAKYRAENLDKVRQTSRESAKRSRLANPEKARAAKKRSEAKYPDRVRARKRRHYQKHRDRILIKMRRYYADNADKFHVRRVKQYWDNPEKGRAAARNWYKENTEKGRITARRSYIVNPTQAKERTKKWRAANPQKVFIAHQKRKARKQGLPHTLTTDEWQWVLIYWNGHCVYCGNASEEITLDHYIPLNHKQCPGTVIENCLPACRSCNSSKNDSDAVYWMNWRFGEERTQVVIEAIETYFESLKKK